MRKLIYLLLLPLAVAVTACGGKKGTSNNESILATMDSVDAHGLQRMQTSIPSVKRILSLRVLQVVVDFACVLTKENINRYIPYTDYCR